MHHPEHDADPRIISKILKQDIATRKLMLSLPGLTERERLRHDIYITNAQLHRLHLKHEPTSSV